MWAILMYVMAFSTIHVEQFKSESEHRRKLLDCALYHLQPTHLKRVVEFSRVLK